MTRKTDKQLGMLKPIRRRDFVQGALVTAGTALTAHQLAAADALSPPPAAELLSSANIRPPVPA